MDLKQAVLRQLLGKSDYQSGEALARGAGVSRNAVWKAIGRLKDEGYDIEAAPRLGYRLSARNDRLSAEAVEALLCPAAAHCRISVLDTVDSTNTRLKREAEEGAPEGRVIAAVRQTGGRGRMGRSFYSPPDTGLYFSLLVRPSQAAADTLTLTALAAVATARGIEAVTGRQVGIKWVNDLYWQGRKVCGILTEAAIDMESGGVQWLVIGIGVNLSAPKEGFPADFAGKAGAVETQALPGRRTELLAAILNEFFTEYPRRAEKRFLDEYRRRSILTGKRVCTSDGRFPGGAAVRDIDDNGGLVLECPDGALRTLATGEVSILWEDEKEKK